MGLKAANHSEWAELKSSKHPVWVQMSVFCQRIQQDEKMNILLLFVINLDLFC